MFAISDIHAYETNFALQVYPIATADRLMNDTMPTSAFEQPTDVLLNHIYVHVPFCSSKCTFCALYSVVHHADPAKAYLQALTQEVQMARDTFALAGADTIYFGGGTPTQLSDALYLELLDLIANTAQPEPTAEWTSECAPGTLSSAKLKGMKAHGVSRLSFGVQSFDDKTLKAINRRHTCADVHDTFALAREHGMDRLGLDLIACLPDVSAARWQNDLNEAMLLNPEHVSVYGLTPEPGTVMTRQIERGSVSLWDEDTYIARQDTAESFLEARGFTRYEISNYAKPGQRCRHNMAYWQGKDYIGFGPGASSRVGLQRWTNTADVRRYTEALLKGQVPPRELENLSPEADLSERHMFTIRTEDGLRFPSSDGPFASLYADWTVSLEHLETQGLVARNTTHWHLTYEGRWMADSVSRALVA